MTALYLDETFCYSNLAAIVTIVAGTWVLWGAGWLRRIELKDIAAPCVRALGLAFRSEGWGPVVRASGTLAGQPVEVRWELPVTGRVRVRARVGGRWVDVPSDRVESELRTMTLPS